MSMKAAILYRLSDYPNRPQISVYAESPINVSELRAYLILLQDKYAGKQPSFSICVVKPDTGERAMVMEIDADTSVEHVDLAAFA